MSKSDVVVIGNGFAGLMSALVSADQGKKVTLLSYGAGTFPLNSGVIDVLGYDDSGKAVANPAQAVSAVADEHPYKKIGTQATSATEVRELEQELYNDTGCKNLSNVIKEVASAFNVAVQ